MGGGVDDARQFHTFYHDLLLLKGLGFLGVPKTLKLFFSIEACFRNQLGGRFR